jgi:ubiquinone/menaquinone biosynthesis C-methylase UbiE
MGAGELRSRETIAGRAIALLSRRTTKNRFVRAVFHGKNEIIDLPLASLKRRIGRFATTMAVRYSRLKSGMKAKPDGAPAELSETAQWLQQNRLERMDATLDMFDEKRREFHLDRYRFACQRVAGKCVLDCATGTGYGVRLLREVGGAELVLGVDIEPTAINYAHKNHQVEATQFLCSSADHLALPDACVDIIVSFETIEHVPDDRALIEEFHRVLRPDGQLIVSTPNQWPLKDTPFHVREYDLDSFVNVLKTRFDCVEIYNQNSGSETPLNRGQARGIVATTAANADLAECYVATCRRK